MRPFFLNAKSLSLRQNAEYESFNLEVLKSWNSELVDWIYLDPPFFSNRNYEVIWGDAGEIRSFQDKKGKQTVRFNIQNDTKNRKREGNKVRFSLSNVSV